MWWKLEVGKFHSLLPEMEPSCFFDEDDLVSCLKEFSSSASPSPHQDGWPYSGVPRGSAATSPVTGAHDQWLFNNAQQRVHISLQLRSAKMNGSLNHGATEWTQLMVVCDCDCDCTLISWSTPGPLNYFRFCHPLLYTLSDTSGIYKTGTWLALLSSSLWKHPALFSEVKEWKETTLCKGNDTQQRSLYGF